MMSNIASPWRYDIEVRSTLEPENIRPTTIWRSADRGVSDVAVVAMSRKGRRKILKISALSVPVKVCGPPLIESASALASDNARC